MKLNRPWTGPWEIIKKLNNVVYQVSSGSAKWQRQTHAKRINLDQSWRDILTFVNSIVPVGNREVIH